MEFDNGIKSRQYLVNTFWLGNRISPACNRELIKSSESNRSYRDPYFGNAWTWTPTTGTAVYGLTSDLPSAPIDVYSAGDFLRVPYRRVPVIDVHSVSELMEFASYVSRSDRVRGVWRGQSRQYTLPRTYDERMKLYGDVGVVEPSLLPSASRERGYFPDWFEAWSAILDLFLEHRVKALSATDFSRRDELKKSLDQFRCTYAFRQWGFATAQHYGIPSVGLDVTNDLAVALFFALHRFNTDPATGLMSITRSTDADSPVIYGLGGFEGQDLLDDKDLAPPWLECARPKAQGASFFSAGWGDATNKAADKIYVAFRLVGHTTWRSLRNAGSIFPSHHEDAFLAFLLQLREECNNPILQNLLQRVYCTS